MEIGEGRVRSFTGDVRLPCTLAGLSHAGGFIAVGLNLVGGWVGGWVGNREVEEDEAVRMSYCELWVGVGGWVGWVEEE